VAAGVRAVQHLNQLMLEHEAVAVRTPTLVPFVANAFGADGKPAHPALDVTLGIVLDDLAWLGRALGSARAEGQLPPPGVRMRAATAARA
jgi:hypothetical protein